MRGADEKKCKIRHKGVGNGAGEAFFGNFVTPCISGKQLKLETSNLACRLTKRDTDENSTKIGQREVKWSCDLL